MCLDSKNHVKRSKGKAKRDRKEKEARELGRIDIRQIEK